MNEKQRTSLEARLIEERDKLNRSLGRLEEVATIGTDDDGDLTNYPMHPADEGTDTITQEQELSLLANDSQQLVEIDDALRRLYAEPESFGTCTSCGAAIPAERLDLVPWTRLCQDCQTTDESSVSR